MFFLMVVGGGGSSGLIGMILRDSVDVKMRSLQVDGVRSIVIELKISVLILLMIS